MGFERGRRIARAREPIAARVLCRRGIVPCAGALSIRR
jgi:hypothetical protein